MGKFNYITTLDQIMGYFVMQMGEDDKQYLGIITPDQIYIYNVLPQGAKIAWEYFQHEMMHLNEGLDYVKVFIDNRVVIGRNPSFEEYLKELDEVLIRIEDAGLQLNISKTKWAVSEVK